MTGPIPTLTLTPAERQQVVSSVALEVHRVKLSIPDRECVRIAEAAVEAVREGLVAAAAMRVEGRP